MKGKQTKRSAKRSSVNQIDVLATYLAQIAAQIAELRNVLRFGVYLQNAQYIIDHPETADKLRAAIDSVVTEEQE